MFSIINSYLFQAGFIITIFCVEMLQSRATLDFKTNFTIINISVSERATNNKIFYGHELRGQHFFLIFEVSD